MTWLDSYQKITIKKTIHDKLDKIIELVGKLKLDEVERPLQVSQVFTELENDWEPYIKISIDNKKIGLL